MGLTRTRFSQANTTVARIQDPITVLNSESTLANVDVGFLINRDLGSSSNVALFWKESTDEFVTALTANTGISDANLTITSYANLRVGTFFGNIGGSSSLANVYISGSLIPSANVAYDLGTDGRRFRDLWLSGTTLHMGDQRLTVTNGEWRFSTPTTTVVLGAESTVGNLTVTGNLNLQGSSTTFDSNNLTVQDSIIELHTLANLAPLTGDDGRDIGLKFHYYKTQDEHAFLGWSNSTGYLEWYDSGREGVGNVFTGNTFGTIKSGALILANSTASTSTTTGALRVSGGAGIAGNVYVGTNLVVGSINVASNLTTAATNINTLFSSATTQDANLGTATTNITAANVRVQTLDSNLGTVTTNISALQANIIAANTKIQTLDANLGTISVTVSNHETLFANAATQQVQINHIVSTANANAYAYLTSTGATVTAATNAFKTQVESNISPGTAYISFVNATSGNVSQNVNTGLTYNPNTGNLTAYGLITTTGLFWANGTAFSSGSNYGNTQVAEYLPGFNGTIGGTLSGSSQPNVTDLGTLTGLDVTGDTYLTGFVTMDGTGNGTPQYSVKIGNADGEKIAFATRGTAGYGVGIEVLEDDESGYGKLNVTASEIHFNIKDGSAANVQNNAIVLQANGIVTLDGTTDSTSTTTGALVVRGGAAIGGNVYAGKIYTTDGLYWAGNGNVISTGGGGGGTLTASNTAPSSPNTSDFWYYIAGDILFQYIDDGDSEQWVDTSSPYNTQTQTITDAVLSNVTVSSWANVTTVRTSLGITPTTVGIAPPGSPYLGDTWYNTDEDVMYQYINDGVGSWWVDISSDTLSTIGATNLLETTIQGNLLPSANITYNLGSTTQRFKDLFLSGTTIDLGGATIKTDATSGAIALIPQPTVANPNPTGIVVSPAGTVSTVSTTGGNLTANAISNSSNTAVTTNTTTFGNITTSNVYADRFFYSNGTAFSSSNFGNTEVAAYLVANPQGSTYSNSNVATYLTSNISGLATRTDALTVPVGTTAQRPATASNGAIRYNTTIAALETYLYIAGWQSIISDTYAIEYLAVAGGGGAGRSNGAAGAGAGGLLNGTFSIISKTTISIVVGGGGAAATSTGAKGSNGTNSTIVYGSVTTIGGGGSGTESGGTYNSGAVGGSGGGGVRGGSGAAGTAGQGNAGGSNVSDGSPHYGGGGGGGAGAAGTNGSSGGSGNGGIGLQFSAWATATSTGDSGYYAGGGAGGSYDQAGAAGSGGTRGTGGGGQGGTNKTTEQLAGQTNTGGGGGGHGNVGSNGGAGGSGIVILRYPGTQRGLGGTYSYSSGYSYHLFTASTNFTA